jgi:hypothetical protein
VTHALILLSGLAGSLAACLALAVVAIRRYRAPSFFRPSQIGDES